MLLTKQKILKNISDIYTGGPKVIWTKMLNKKDSTFAYLLAPIAIPIALVLKFISLFYPVRIQRVDIGRIGHCYPPFAYLAREKMGKAPAKGFDLFYFDRSLGKVSNHQLKKMFERNLRCSDATLLLAAIRKWGIQFFGEKTFSMEFNTYPVGLKQWLKYEHHNNFPIMEFTTEEKAQAEKRLEEIGIPKDATIICFHVRDDSYLSSVAPQYDWQYHDYRDARIDNYITAVNRLADETGYYFVRMGVVSKQVIQDKHPRVIDYVNSPLRNDLTDMYLAYRSRFFIATDSGMSIFPEMMGKPLVFLNMVCQARFDPWGHHVIYIPKKLYLKAEDRYLTFSEIMHKYVGIDPSTEKLYRQGIEMEENSADEIYHAVMEMEQTLNNTWKTTEEDKTNQDRYWEIYGRAPNGPNLRLGTDFLRRHKQLLK